MRTRAPSLARGLGAAGVAALLAACAPDAATAPREPGAPTMARAGAAAAAGQSGLAEVRAATAKYHRVEAALADGYVSTVECAALPGVGAMGIHYINNALMGPPAPAGDATFDPTRPEVLVYEPQKNGKLRLVAVEYLVWRAPWAAAHPGAAGPAFQGVPFVESFGPAAHGLPDHYELHVWLWRHNPSGMFAQWNPDVTCAYAPRP